MSRFCHFFACVNCLHDKKMCVVKVCFVPKNLTHIKKKSNCDFFFQSALPECIITKNSDFDNFVIIPLWYELMLHLRNIIHWHQIHFYNYIHIVWSSNVVVCGMWTCSLSPYQYLYACWMKFASVLGNYRSESQFQQSWIYYFMYLKIISR